MAGRSRLPARRRKKASGITIPVGPGSREALVKILDDLNDDVAEARDDRSWNALATLQRLAVQVHSEIARLDAEQRREDGTADLTDEQAKQMIADAFRGMPLSLREELFGELAEVIGQPLVRVVG